MKYSKKTMKIGLIILLLLFVMQLLPSCLMIGFINDYNYILSEKEESGDFIPYLHLKHNVFTISLLIFRFDIDRLPHDFVMLQYDPTYLERDSGYASFVLDSLYIEFDDGSRVDCVTLSMPEDQRTFLVSDLKEHVFEGVVIKEKTFTVHISGTAITSSGKRKSFKSEQKYRYDDLDVTFHTILDEWSSI